MAKFNLTESLAVLGALAKLGPLAVSVGLKILAALPDGVTADEAEAIASEAFLGEDLKIRVRGVDVLDDAAERLLVSGFARVARNLVDALTHKQG